MDLEWSKPMFHPNEEATLTIKTSPESLCFVSAVNEATKFWSTNKLNIESLMAHFMEWNYFDNTYTYEKGNDLYLTLHQNPAFDTLQVLFITLL